jgi:hypothetical protein
VSRARYELGSYIPEVANLNSHGREDLKSCIAITGWVHPVPDQIFLIEPSSAGN